MDQDEVFWIGSLFFAMFIFYILAAWCSKQSVSVKEIHGILKT